MRKRFTIHGFYPPWNEDRGIPGKMSKEKYYRGEVSPLTP
jgi:hypothetical protein